MTSDIDDRQALEAFLLDNPELERLEALLEEFNLFEAIGAVRPELRHSDFLAFLLNPQETHGLGDAFAKRLLQRALGQATSTVAEITPLEIALWDLDNLEIRREWRHVDILLLDEQSKLAVIIENKVLSAEHGDQLRRYWLTVGRAYPTYRTIGLFLTPDGQEPSDRHYLPIDYDLIYELVHELSETRAGVLRPDVRTTMNHYAQMLRRHIMPDSDVAKLCRQIYRKHKRALDLIYEYRPDVQEEIRLLLEELIDGEPGLTMEHSTKTRIRFVPDAWDSPILKRGEGWTSSGRMLLAEFTNAPNSLSLRFFLGPGPQDIRQRIFDMAHSKSPPFSPPSSLSERYSTLLHRKFLQSQDYEDTTLDVIEARVRERWQHFLTQDLPQLTEVIREQGWLWPGETHSNPRPR